MSYDESRMAEAVLALLAVHRFDNGRAWKGYDFEIMDRLHAEGFLLEPRGKAKSVVLTPEGLERGLAHARRLFGTG